MIAAASSQVWWWLARASGVVAWAATAAAVIWGLALSSKVVRRRRIPAWLLDLHRYLGTFTLVLVAAHLIALAADTYTDFGVRELFIPGASTWKPGAVTWGIVSLYLLLIVQISSWLMRRLPRRVWHSIHMLSFVVFATGTVHGALAGTDRERPIVQIGALAVIIFILFLVLFRLLGVWGALADDPPAVTTLTPPPTAASSEPEAPKVPALDPALAERLARLGSSHVRS